MALWTTTLHPFRKQPRGDASSGMHFQSYRQLYHFLWFSRHPSLLIFKGNQVAVRTDGKHNDYNLTLEPLTLEEREPYSFRLESSTICTLSTMTST